MPFIWNINQDMNVVQACECGYPKWKWRTMTVAMSPVKSGSLLHTLEGGKSLTFTYAGKRIVALLYSGSGMEGGTGWQGEKVWRAYGLGEEGRKKGRDREVAELDQWLVKTGNSLYLSRIKPGTTDRGFDEPDNFEGSHCLIQFFCFLSWKRLTLKLTLIATHSWNNTSTVQVGVDTEIPLTLWYDLHINLLRLIRIQIS